jgi:hypothetical protein
LEVLQIVLQQLLATRAANDRNISPLDRLNLNLAAIDDIAYPSAPASSHRTVADCRPDDKRDSTQTKQRRTREKRASVNTVPAAKRSAVTTSSE